MKHKKHLSVLLAAVMVLALFAGCSGGGNPGSSASENPGGGESVSSEPTVLRMAVQSDPNSLAPYGNGGPRTVPCNMVYEYLAKSDCDGNLENWMAKEIVNNGDGTYDIEIYDYITDSAGNKFTASDVVFSFNKFIEDGKQATYVAGLDKVEAIDDTHVRTMAYETPGGTDCMLSNVRMITEKAWNDSPDEMITTPRPRPCRLKTATSTCPATLPSPIWATLWTWTPWSRCPATRPSSATPACSIT